MPDDAPQPVCSGEPLEDRLARVIATAIWRPEPAMNRNIWWTLGPMRRRNAIDAARAVIAELEKC